MISDRVRHRYPFDPAPVLAQLDLRITGKDITDNQPVTLHDHEAAELLGVTQRTVQRWRRNRSRLSVVMADQAACALGLHVVLLWPDFHQVVDEIPSWQVPE